MENLENVKEQQQDQYDILSLLGGILQQMENNRMNHLCHSNVYWPGLQVITWDKVVTRHTHFVRPQFHMSPASKTPNNEATEIMFTV